MQNNRINYVMVGTFVTVMLIVFVLVISILAGSTGSTDKYFTVYDNVGGVKYGTLVFYEGKRLHPGLKQVLTGYTLQPLPVHLVFQKDRFLPTRVRAFIDHFTEVMRREPWIAPS